MKRKFANTSSSLSTSSSEYIPNKKQKQQQTQYHKYVTEEDVQWITQLSSSTNVIPELTDIEELIEYALEISKYAAQVTTNVQCESDDLLRVYEKLDVSMYGEFMDEIGGD